MLVCRLLALLALGLCGAALADHLADSPLFCGFESGCDAVMSSAFGRPLGIPLPAVGLIAFGFFLVLTAFASPMCITCLRGAAVLCGLSGVLLLLAQIIVLRQICALCLAIDLTAVGLMIAVWRLPQAAGSGPAPAWWTLGGCVLAGMVVALLPVAWSQTQPLPPIPDPVRGQWRSDRITVVEVTDFDCVHCRTAHAVLERWRSSVDGSFIHWVRLPAAMPGHENARPAARAFLAAQAQGKAEPMAAALFASTQPTVEECRQLAVVLELNMDEYDRMVGAPSTDAAIDATNNWAKSAGRGLPLVWVQNQFYYGVPTLSWLRGAWRRAERFIEPRSISAATLGQILGEFSGRSSIRQIASLGSLHDSASR